MISEKQLDVLAEKFKANLREMAESVEGMDTLEALYQLEEDLWNDKQLSKKEIAEKILEASSGKKKPNVNAETY